MRTACSIANQIGTERAIKSTIPRRLSISPRPRPEPGALPARPARVTSDMRLQYLTPNDALKTAWTSARAAATLARDVEANQQVDRAGARRRLRIRGLQSRHGVAGRRRAIHQARRQSSVGRPLPTERPRHGDAL